MASNARSANTTGTCQAGVSRPTTLACLERSVRVDRVEPKRTSLALIGTLAALAAGSTRNTMVVFEVVSITTRKARGRSAGGAAVGASPAPMAASVMVVRTALAHITTRPVGAPLAVVAAGEGHSIDEVVSLARKSAARVIARRAQRRPARNTVVRCQVPSTCALAALGVRASATAAVRLAGTTESGVQVVIVVALGAARCRRTGRTVLRAREAPHLCEVVPRTALRAFSVRAGRAALGITTATTRAIHDAILASTTSTARHEARLTRESGAAQLAQSISVDVAGRFARLAHGTRALLARFTDSTRHTHFPVQVAVIIAARTYLLAPIDHTCEAVRWAGFACCANHNGPFRATRTCAVLVTGDTGRRTRLACVLTREVEPFLARGTLRSRAHEARVSRATLCALSHCDVVGGDSVDQVESVKARRA